MRSGIGLVAFVVLVLCGSPDAHAELDSGVALKLAIWEQGKHARTQLVAEAIIKIGTLPSCDVQLHDKRVARVHAIIEIHDPHDVRIIDLGARSGTFLNGKRVKSQVPGMLLRNGDELKLGDTRLVVEIQPASK